jgi:hypothetical protein
MLRALAKVVLTWLTCAAMLLLQRHTLCHYGHALELARVAGAL